jgi:pimeloyl-ACP methyl ester carboxylesterase
VVGTVGKAKSALLIAALLAAFVSTSATAEASPGTVLASQAIDAPPGALAWKVRYLSTGLRGEPIAVTGIIIAPKGGGRNRPVVAWAHPTTGVAEKCAPSARSDVLSTIPALGELIARGYVVAATDYPGLGSPGPHPYLIGSSEARAVIDIVRAARDIPQAHAGTHFVAWGHSQGGHAALFVAQTAGAYAPELLLVGVVAASPPTQLAQILRTDIAQSTGRVLTSYAVWSWSHLYDIPLETALRLRTATPIVRAIAQTCAQTKDEAYVLGLDAAWTTPRLIKPTLYATPPWKDLFSANSPAQAPVDYFIAQGTNDTIVPPATTAAFVTALCRSGRAVEFDSLKGMGHMRTAFASAPQALVWMENRFAGKPAPSNCAR